MLTTCHTVDFPYTTAELQALFRLANEQDVEKGGRSDARSAVINICSHHRRNHATWEESDILGTFYFRWDAPRLCQIETEEGFTVEDLREVLGRLELQALGLVKHGDVTRDGTAP